MKKLMIAAMFFPALAGSALTIPAHILSFFKFQSGDSRRPERLL